MVLYIVSHTHTHNRHMISVSLVGGFKFFGFQPSCGINNQINKGRSDESFLAAALLFPKKGWEHVQNVQGIPGKNAKFPRTQLRRPGSVFVDPGVARELEENFSVLACLGMSWHGRKGR